MRGCHLAGRAERTGVLRRRRVFLDGPAGFFRREGEPVRAEKEPDLFRLGVPRAARATGAAGRDG
ncbi:hypothetical protein [Streptomyces sp. NPDC002540]